MTHVPREPLAAIIEEWLALHLLEHDPDTRPSKVGQQRGFAKTDQTGALARLSFETGVPERTLWRVRTGIEHGHDGRKHERTQITVELADRILTGIGRPDLFHTHLAA